MKPRKNFWDGSTQAMRWHFVGFSGAAAAFALRLISEYFDSTLLTYGSLALMLVALMIAFVAVFFLPHRRDSSSLISDVRGWRDRWRERHSGNP